jgi:tetratricopeptide (TPR) repeat protein
MAILPEDNAIHGKSRLVDGYLQLSKRTADMKAARADFEEARKLLPKSPDPHLGLALIQMKDGDLDKAEEELQMAKRAGFQPGRRQQRDLADGYKARGEKWLAGAKRARGLTQLQDSLRRADRDLAHAQDLYNSVAPLFNGVQLAETVSRERDKAAKTLAQAEQAAQPELVRENP